MDAKPTLALYAIMIADILKIGQGQIKFLNRVNRGKNWKYEELSNFSEAKVGDGSSWSLGEFKVSAFLGKAECEISTFKLYQLPHCCAYVVSCNAMVNSNFRNMGIGTILNSLRQDIARAKGYSAILCTDVDTNSCQRKLLKKQKWEDIHSIQNKRTNHLVHLSVKDL